MSTTLARVARKSSYPGGSMPRTFLTTTPCAISTMATVTLNSTEIMLASRSRMLSTMATYKALFKPHSLLSAWQGEGSRHALLYAMVRRHQPG
jgi:hypothetical protein